MDFRLGHHDPCPGCVLNSILGLSLLSAYTPNAPFLVIAMKCFDVLDLEGFHVEIIKSEDCHRVLDLKS